MEDARPVQAALGHEEREVAMEVDPFAENLDGDDDTRDEPLARQREFKTDRSRCEP
jgi:hypothetical protein